MLIKENKYKILIDTILSENDFFKTQIDNLGNKTENENKATEEIINLIKICTSNNDGLRPSFNDILENINQQINCLNKNDSKKTKNKNNCKDIFHDYSFYQLSKYNDDLIMTKEILKNYKYKQELIDINEEYEISKEQFINYYKYK